jgi:hypothetical protein
MRMEPKSRGMKKERRYMWIGMLLWFRKKVVTRDVIRSSVEDGAREKARREL